MSPAAIGGEITLTSIRKMKAGAAYGGAVGIAVLVALAACWAGPARANETEQAVKQLRKAVKADPTNAQLRFKLAMALSEEGRIDLQRYGKRMADQVFDEAIAEYGKAIELQPSNTEARKSLVSELVFKSRFGEARSQLREIVKLNPDDASAHFALARADLHQDGGDLNEAIAELRVALQIEPGNMGAWNDLGEALGRVGKYEDAAAAFGEALKLHPDDDTAHFNLGEALRHAGKVDEAVDQFREALRLNAQWKEMLTTNLSTDLAAKDLALARSDAQILEKLGYPVDPQLLEHLKIQDTDPK
jgi:tetratricopeptide (TPR) repeat protein